MLGLERPGRRVTGTGTELDDEGHPSTPGQVGEALGPVRPAIPAFPLFMRLGPDPERDLTTCAKRLWVPSRVPRRPARSRGSLGRRQRQTRLRRQMQGSRPPDEPPLPGVGEADR
jgi:hypothetical protein